MHNNKQTTQFDFRSCQFPTLKGTQKTEVYTPDMFVFEGQSGIMRLELWESDAGEFLRGEDDKLGVLEITGVRAGNGEQVHIFPMSGAEYELRYTVIADED